MWEFGEGQTDRHTDGRDHYTFRLGYACFVLAVWQQRNHLGHQFLDVTAVYDQVATQPVTQCTLKHGVRIPSRTSKTAKKHSVSQCTEYHYEHSRSLRITRMWANAQRDGRPAEYRWCPLFNAPKFG